MKRKWNKLSVCLMIMMLCMSMNVSAAESAAEDEIEANSIEQNAFEEGAVLDQWDTYMENTTTGEERAASILGIVRLGRSGAELGGNYSTSYDYVVDKIGIKNLKLQYKTSLGVWKTLVTLDERYVTNDSVYIGSFITKGVVGRTYRLKCTHYITDNGKTKTRSNQTGEVEF